LKNGYKGLQFGERREQMDIERKREFVIVGVFAAGILFPLALLRTFGIKPVVPEGWFPVFHYIYFVGIKVTALANLFIESKDMLLLIFAITHILTCLLLGWIIARLIFRNKKSG
jgi:hypothetical protein